MSKEMLETIFNKKAIAIIRGISPEKIIKLGDALLAGGIGCIEVTFDHRSPEGLLHTLESIRLLDRHFQGRISVGAGTVISVKEVQDAAAAGAKYIISPNVDPSVIAETKKLDLVSMPGALTPSEILNAYNAGADIVKVFPAGRMGAAYIKDLKGPLPHIPLAAVGGMSADNISDFKKIGIRCFGFGGNLVNTKSIDEGNFQVITDYASRIMSVLND